MYCYIMLPLDLHVLSLPLAFILSQDQTLHCKNLFLSIFTKINPVYSIQNTNKLFRRDFHYLAWLLLHNFKEHLSAVTSLEKTDLFAFGTTKLIFPSFYSKQKMRYFFRPFPFPASLSSSSRNPISPTPQSTLRHKAGANVWNNFYKPNKSYDFLNNNSLSILHILINRHIQK